MLSELGKNVPHDRVNSWSKTDLVYYFNSEKKFEKDVKRVGTIYKTLTCVYINPFMKNYKNPFRKGYCHTFRKSHYHKTLKYAHPPNASLKITRDHKQIDCINIFNKKSIFICYDPLSFLSIIAAMCGCISVIIKVDGISNQSEWIKTTAVAQYAKETKIDKLYGIAYGLNEIGWARNTLHLVKEQWIKIREFFREKTIKPFLEDLKNMESLENTLKNNYF